MNIKRVMISAVGKIFLHMLVTDPGLSPEDCHLLPKIRPSGDKMTGGPAACLILLCHQSLFPGMLVLNCTQRSTLGA